jgi:hypothetical protein
MAWTLVQFAKPGMYVCMYVCMYVYALRNFALENYKVFSMYVYNVHMHTFSFTIKCGFVYVCMYEYSYCRKLMYVCMYGVGLQ